MPLLSQMWVTILHSAAFQHQKLHQVSNVGLQATGHQTEVMLGPSAKMGNDYQHSMAIVWNWGFSQRKRWGKVGVGASEDSICWVNKDLEGRARTRRTGNLRARLQRTGAQRHCNSLKCGVKTMEIFNLPHVQCVGSLELKWSPYNRTITGKRQDHDSLWGMLKFIQ